MAEADSLCLYGPRVAAAVRAVNVYDFDGTLYRGDSTVDFWLYCLRRKPVLLRFLPLQVSGAVLYVLHLTDKRGFKERFYSFLRGLDGDPCLVEEFWDGGMKKIAGWYAEKRRDDDVVISASPEFLLRPVCARLGISRLIASGVEPRTGECTTPNCEGDEKVRRFRAEFGEDARIEEFFSDSKKDMPLAGLADRVFWVRKVNVVIDKEK